MRRIKLLCFFSVCILIMACGPIESGVLDTGVFNKGGTDDPRRLIDIAYNRLYKQNRIVGARNVLKRAIERSKRTGDFYALAVSYNMMGFTYVYKEKDPSISEMYFGRAIETISGGNYNCELVHSYVGIALSNYLKEIYHNAYVYEEKAKHMMKTIRSTYKENPRVCEYGPYSINIAEKRVVELSEFLKCKRKRLPSL